MASHAQEMGYVAGGAIISTELNVLHQIKAIEARTTDLVEKVGTVVIVAVNDDMAVLASAVRIGSYLKTDPGNTLLR